MEEMLKYAQQVYDPSSEFNKLLRTIHAMSELIGIGCYEFTFLYNVIGDLLYNGKCSIEEVYDMVDCLAASVIVEPDHVRAVIGLFRQ